VAATETVATATVRETSKVTAGDIGGGGGDTAIAATATALKETKVSKLKRIIESNPNPTPRDLWKAENKERLQSLKEIEISLEDTAVGRKKIVLEQQLNAATLSMSPQGGTRYWRFESKNGARRGLLGPLMRLLGASRESIVKIYNLTNYMACGVSYAVSQYVGIKPIRAHRTSPVPYREHQSAWFH
jgi:hypothetical protein